MAKTLKPKAERRKSPRTDKTTMTATAVAASTISTEDIARRAFEFYCARGGGHGHALEDWLQAERELTGASK